MGSAARSAAAKKAAETKRQKQLLKDAASIGQKEGSLRDLLAGGRPPAPPAAASAGVQAEARHPPAAPAIGGRAERGQWWTALRFGSAIHRGVPSRAPVEQSGWG